MRDLLFKTEDFIFSYRVAGLLRHGDTVLLQRYKDDYTAIGGHVLGLETHEAALKREFKEELDMNIGVDDLVAVGENFFTWDGTPWHQICFYYYVHMEGENNFPMEGILRGQDEWEDGVFELDFCWIPLEQLTEIHLIPEELRMCILEKPDRIRHFVSRE